MFDQPLFRFALSGTLITCYMVTDLLARRTGRVRSKLHSPRWTHPLIFVSIGGFYLLIGPTGGSLLGGWLNGLGIALAGLAFATRWTTSVRYPDLAARSLFYVALPVAVGVPWGLLALSLPACAASVYCCQRAERLRGEPAASEVVEPRYRMIQGIW